MPNRILITTGYGGKPKIEAEIDGEYYIIEEKHLEEVLLKLMKSRGYTTAITKKQKYPRVFIND